MIPERSLVAAQGFAELIAQGVGGVEGGHGLLKNHRHACTAKIAALAFRHRKEINAVKVEAVGVYLRLARQ